MSHRNARLTVHGRRLLVERVCSGRPVAHVAAEMGISRATAHKWVRRWRDGRRSGPARPLQPPAHDPAPHCRRAWRPGCAHCGRPASSGPARIGPILGLPASTVHRILTRHGLNRLAWLDRPTGSPSAATNAPGPANWSTSTSRNSATSPTAAAGARSAGRPATSNRQATTDQRKSCKPVIGYSYIHSAVDDHSRLAYSEVLTDERKETATGLLAAGPGLLRRPRHHRRTRPDRQRLLLQVQAVHPDPHRSRHRPQTHPALPAPDQRQGRTLQPHPARRMGLPAALHQQRPNAPQPWQTSSTPTTTTAATPHSAASHPSAASTTLRVNTPSRCRAVELSDRHSAVRPTPH